MIKRLCVVTTMTMSALLVPLATSASADAGCPGTRDVWRNWNNSAGSVAAATQGYDTADGMCVSLVAKGVYASRSKVMLLTVCNDLKRSCQTDSGTYMQYAGPAYRTDRPSCFWVHAKMGDGYGNLIMDKSEYFGYCD